MTSKPLSIDIRAGESSRNKIVSDSNSIFLGQKSDDIVTYPDLINFFCHKNIKCFINY